VGEPAVKKRREIVVSSWQTHSGVAVVVVGMEGGVAQSVVEGVVRAVLPVEAQGLAPAELRMQMARMLARGTRRSRGMGPRLAAA